MPIAVGSQGSEGGTPTPSGQQVLGNPSQGFAPPSTGILPIGSIGPGQVPILRRRPPSPRPLTGPPTSGRVRQTRSTQQERESTVSAADGIVPDLSGLFRVGLKVFYVNAAGGLLYVAGLFARGEIESVDEVRFDGVVAAVPDGLISYRVYRGTLTQTVDPWLSALGYTQTHPGLAYMVLKILPAAPVRGIPQVLITGKGAKRLDPRENLLPKSEVFTAGDGWSALSGAPTVTAGQTNEFGWAGATRLNFAGAGTWRRQVTGLTVANAESWRGAFRVKANAGTPNVTFKLYRGSTTQVVATLTVTLGATWRWIELLGLTNATDSSMTLEVSTSGAADVLLYKAQLHRATEDTGYVKTTGAAITPGTRYTRTPALIAYSVRLKYGPSAASFVNVASVGRVAAFNEEEVEQGEARHTCDLAMTSRQNANGWVDTIRAHGSFDVVREEGLWTLLADRSVDAATFSFDDSNVSKVKLLPRSTKETPTRVIVKGVDPAKDWVSVSVIAETAAVQAGTREAIESEMELQGCTSPKMLRRQAEYLLARQTLSGFTVEFTALPVAELVKRGDRIKLSWSARSLVNQDFVVTSMKLLENDEWEIRADKYDPGIYTTPTMTDSAPPSTTLPDPFSQVPPFAVGVRSITAGLFFIEPARTGYAELGAYPSGAAYTPIDANTTIVGSKVHDGNIADNSAMTFAAAATAYGFVVDFGVGRAHVGKVRIYYSENDNDNPTGPISINAVEVRDSLSDPWVGLGFAGSESGQFVVSFASPVLDSGSIWRIEQDFSVGNRAWRYYRFSLIASDLNAVSEINFYTPSGHAAAFHHDLYFDDASVSDRFALSVPGNALTDWDHPIQAPQAVIVEPTVDGASRGKVYSVSLRAYGVNALGVRSVQQAGNFHILEVSEAVVAGRFVSVDKSTGSPALSQAGEARLVVEAGGVVKASVDGAAYVPVGGGASGARIFFAGGW